MHRHTVKLHAIGACLAVHLPCRSRLLCLCAGVRLTATSVCLSLPEGMFAKTAYKPGAITAVSDSSRYFVMRVEDGTGVAHAGADALQGCCRHAAALCKPLLRLSSCRAGGCADSRSLAHRSPCVQGTSRTWASASTTVTRRSTSRWRCRTMTSEPLLLLPTRAHLSPLLAIRCIALPR